jgi:hypothetical protein
MSLISDFELQAVRPEIRELFKDKEPDTWRRGFPTELETMLLLREINLSLLQILKISNHNTKAGSHSEDDIEPKKTA